MYTARGTLPPTGLCWRLASTILAGFAWPCSPPYCRGPACLALVDLLDCTKLGREALELFMKEGKMLGGSLDLLGHVLALSDHPCDRSPDSGPVAPIC